MHTYNIHIYIHTRIYTYIILYTLTTVQYGNDVYQNLQDNNNDILYTDLWGLDENSYERL